MAVRTALRRLPWWGASSLGLACAVFGAILVFRPFDSLSALIAVVAVGAFLMGVSSIAAARRSPSRWPAYAAGLVWVAVGVAVARVQGAQRLAAVRARPLAVEGFVRQEVARRAVRPPVGVACPEVLQGARRGHDLRADREGRVPVRVIQVVVRVEQRRYGLGGDDIMVYKFRTMTVQEDGDRVVQAQKGDKRLTSIGAFLRRTSLDELPQFFNVVAGTMSIVGPRPHAVAHNEQYRKLIDGYMIRHKVKPGITGWAQVNGFRGETETVDKMRKRVEHDLDYLRNWSVSLDLWIMFKTLITLWNDRNAY